jgi:thymidylate synthase ThyX
MPTRDDNITARIICDSVNRWFPDCRLTTYVLTYPRIILPELSTHRMFSKSTASSRAIPVSKQIQKVLDSPFIPSWIGRNRSGMQAPEEVDDDTKDIFKQNWLLDSRIATETARRLDNIGIHKQIANRVLEPFQYVTTILTATDFDNFFHLRCNENAQPEFMALAFKMLEAYVESKPMTTDIHIPFGDQMEHGLTEQDKILVACARCARISYETHDGKRDYKEDLRLAKDLAKNGHMSPFEHVATANKHTNVYVGNFRGWIQQRKKLPGECKARVDHAKLLKTKPDWV